MAAKFFPVPDHPPNQYPLCETDYFRRLDLLCYRCGAALRGSYVTAIDRKYHIEHMTCTVCPALFGANDHYYEHEGNIYCFFHYATLFASSCFGCGLAILKQFVDIELQGQVRSWHPECYMIYKYWNVKMLEVAPIKKTGQVWTDRQGLEVDATTLRRQNDGFSEEVSGTWTVLSRFEEQAATYISDTLLATSKGLYNTAILKLYLFLCSVGVIFAAVESAHKKAAHSGQSGTFLFYRL